MKSLTISSQNILYKNTYILLLVFMALCFAHKPLQAATMVFDNGFESGNLSGFTCSGNCPTISSAIVSNGKYSGDFALTRSMATPYRTEVTLQNGKGDFQFGQEYWMGLSYRYEDWAKDSDAEGAPFQVHARLQDWTVDPDTGKAACTVGSQVSTGPFMVLPQNDIMKFITFGGKTLWSAPVQKKQWLNVVVHFKISTTDNGFIEAWINGNKIGRVDGQNHLAVDSCGNSFLAPYVKFGVYKWNWKEGRPATDSTRRELLIDNIKIAQGADGYATVSPGVVIDPIKDTTPPTVSNVQAAVTETTATVTWNTNEAADSLTKYGTTSTYGLSSGSNLTVTTHSVTLKDLKPGSLYYYQVNSKDSSGNTGSGPNLTFATDKSIAESLVAYWPLDPVSGSTAPDVSGNGHNGTLVNGALMTTSGGVKFDGVNDYLNVGKFDVPGNALSISAWVWADSFSNCSSYDCRIISKSTGTSEQDHYFMVSPIKVGSAMRLRFRLKINGVTSTLIAAAGNLSTKTWFHVAAVYDGVTMRLYKDGVEVGSMAKSGSMTTNSNAAVWIGGNPPSATTRPWKGQIDDVSIYSYALTKEEVIELAK